MNSRSTTPDDLVARGYRYTRSQLDGVLGEVEAYVRENPGQAMLYAFAAGYLLNRLPIGGMLRGLVKLSVFGIKPALFVYGATKAYEATQDEE